MNLPDALKAVAPAVGDGKLVWQQACVLIDETAVRACNGRMWASAQLDMSYPPFFVRHDALLNAVSKDNASLTGPRDNHLGIQSGRSRWKLRCADVADFPPEPERRALWTESLHQGFRDILEVLSKFCGKQDNHIWQMGVWFNNGIAFAANPFALTLKQTWMFEHDIGLPPWAVDMIVRTDYVPNILADCDHHIKLLWGHRLSLTSTKLIEDPAENIVMYAHTIAEDDMASNVMVPANLKSAVTSAKELGATRVVIGNGKVEYVEADKIEFVEEIDLDGPTRTWGVDTLLSALEYADTINLEGEHGKWTGQGYKGVFAGMSG